MPVKDNIKNTLAKFAPKSEVDKALGLFNTAVKRISESLERLEIQRTDKMTEAFRRQSELDNFIDTERNAIKNKLAEADAVKKDIARLENAKSRIQEIVG